jgi:hypothetical protein
MLHYRGTRSGSGQLYEDGGSLAGEEDTGATVHNIPSRKALNEAVNKSTDKTEFEPSYVELEKVWRCRSCV